MPFPQFQNIINYLESNLDTFNKTALNELDALVFSWLSYYHISKELLKKDSFDTVKLKELYNAKYFDGMLFDVFDIPSSKKMLSRIASSPRFREVEVLFYVENTNKQIEKQFSAMTFLYDKNKYFMAFRGTDHSFVGWKEDFNMSFMKHIPSQLSAKKYLEKVISKKKGEYIVAGHSKGGNLAIYASSFIDSKFNKCIKAIYNFDGPSLNAKLIEDERYINTKHLIKKFVPQSSMVGMCFEKTSNYKIIRSNAIGILQHNPFSWEIDGKTLKVLKNTTFESQTFKTGINALINTLDEDELKLFVDSIYGVIEATKVDTAEGFLKDINKNIKVLIDSINQLNPTQKKLMQKVVNIYMTEAFWPKKN